MSDSRSYPRSDNSLLILLGIAIGAILVYALTRRTQTLGTPMQQSVQQHSQPNISTHVQYDTQQNEQLQQMTSQLQKMNSQLENTNSQLRQINSQLYQNNTQLQDTTFKLQRYQQEISQLPPQIQTQLQPQIQPQLQPQIQPQLQPQIQPQLQPKIQPQPKEQISNTIYKNNEKWEIKRGSDGRIKSVNVIRDVKKNI